MSSPVPWVPSYWTPLYQKKQSNAGVAPGLDVYGTNSTNESVLDCLANPPASGITAEAVTVAEEQADNTAHPQTGITPN